MSGRTKVWLLLVALFVAANAWGAWYAVVHHEPIHLGIHLVLLLPAAYAMWRLSQRLAEPA